VCIVPFIVIASFQLLLNSSLASPDVFGISPEILIFPAFLRRVARIGLRALHRMPNPICLTSFCVQLLGSRAITVYLFRVAKYA